MKVHAFPKSARLLKRREFERVIRQGVRFSGKSVYIEILPQKEGPTRLGITVTKKFGDAPVRNKFKRLVREAFRLNQSSLKAAHFNVRPKINPSLMTLTAIAADIKAAGS